MVAFSKKASAQSDGRRLLKRLRHNVDLGVWGLRVTLERFDRQPEMLRSTSDVLEVLKACRKIEDWAMAFRFFQQFKKRFTDGVIFNSCMSICSSLSAWEQSLTIYSDMYTIAGIESNIVSCNTALDAMGKRNWESGIALLENSLQKKHLQCDLISCNSLVGSCLAWELTLSIARDMHGLGLRPDHITHTSLVSTCAESSWERAATSLRLDDIDVTDVQFWNVVANAAARAQAWEKAMLTLSECQASQGVKLDTISFNTAISGFERSARWGLALQFLESLSMSSLRKSSVTLNAAGSACGSSHAWEWSLIDFHTSMGKVRNSFSCSASVSACVSVMEWEMALNGLREATECNTLSQPLLSAALSAGGRNPWVHMLSLLSSWWASGGNVSSESFNAAFQVCYESNESNNAWSVSLDLLSQMRLLRIALDSTGRSSLIRLSGLGAAWITGLSLLADGSWSSSCWSSEVAMTPSRSPSLPWDLKI